MVQKSPLVKKVLTIFYQIAVAVALAITGVILILGGQRLMQTLAANPQAIVDSLSTFTTIFLGIFIEAAPFLLLGTLASGIVEVFFSREDMIRLAPRNPLGGSLFGSLLGFGFPVCECGVVPLTRRLIRKVDAFVALAFVSSFNTGSILAFLVFGPMVDIKSALLFLRVFN